MTSLHMRMLGTCVLPFLFLLNACSQNTTSPPDPADTGASAMIGADGGEVALGKNCFLYVPPNAVGIAEKFTIDEAPAVPPPPAGCRQLGPAYLIDGSASTLSVPAAVALNPTYDPIGDPDDILYRPARLSRLGSDNQWQTVPDSGSQVGLFLNGCTSQLGTFAVHVDTTTGLAGQVQAEFVLRTSGRWTVGGQPLSWTTFCSANFYDPGNRIPVFDCGGDIKVGALTLNLDGPGFYIVTTRREFEAGQVCVLQEPGGAEIPALEMPVEFLDETPTLTSPSTSGSEVSRNSGFTVTWDGVGPGFTWLVVYGNGIEGFVFLGGPTPNDGEYFVTSEVLALFNSGAELTVFLQQNRLQMLAVTGFTANSRVFLETASRVNVVVR